MKKFILVKWWTFLGATQNRAHCTCVNSTRLTRLWRNICEDEVLDILVEDIENAISDSDSDGLSTSDEEPPNVVLTLDTKLLRTVRTINATYKTVTTMHEGVIESVGIKLRLKRFRCVFWTHEDSTDWYSENETQSMATAYRNKCETMSPALDVRLKCSGALQRKTISEACAVVGRPKLAPPFETSSGTPIPDNEED